MYEWWRFQWHHICLEKSEIRIGIEKFNFFLVHLVRSIQTKLKRDNKLKTRKKNDGRWASWCVLGVFETVGFSKRLWKFHFSIDKNYSTQNTVDWDKRRDEVVNP